MTNKQQKKKMTNAEKLKQLEEQALEFPHGRECSEFQKLGINATAKLIRGSLGLEAMGMYRASGLSFDFYIDKLLQIADEFGTEGEKND